MQALNFPEFEFQIVEQEQKKLIFDKVRKKFIPLTPEEWVRQHCVEYLHQLLEVPISRIAIERGIKALNINKRFDIVAFNQLGKADILVECKAPHIEITQETILQAAVYNKTIHSSKLWITNGNNHVWLEISKGRLTRIPLPTKG
jgi:hypothetical protein